VKRMVLVLVVLLALLVAALPAGAITWGELDTEHTNVGAMVVYYTGYGFWQRCSGTLIHERVFLTAGHCTDGIENETEIESIWVNFDPWALNPDTILPVAEVITHPDYNWGSSDPHDIAALVLAEPVTGIDPAPLPEEGMLDALKKDKILRPGGPDAPTFTLVGYGGMLSWPPPEQTYDDMRRVAYSEYVSLTKPWLHMSQLSLKGDSGTCFGDSGGPAFWVDDNGDEIVVGVTSWGDAQCVATSFNYRVDTADSLSFINGIIDGLE
jgi:secreted trypsin-like serine protease